MNKTSLLELAYTYVKVDLKVEYTPSNLYENKRRAWKSHQRYHQRVQGDYFWYRYPVCVACLDELQKQQIIDQKVYDQKLMEDTMRKLAWERLQRNIVMDGDTMIDKKPVRCWILRLIRHIGNTNFKTIFIVFTDHKITCLRVEELHILNDIDTLGTWSVCDFSWKIFFAFFSSLFKYFF